MTVLKTNLPAPQTLPSWLKLPHPLQERAVSRPDAADIEYTSWFPDPGALEIASWASSIRSAVR